MSRFVERANLPHHAGAVILGERYRALLEEPLSARGIEALYVPDNPNVDSRLAGHADLSVLHAGGERIYLAPYLRKSGLHHKLLGLGMDVCFPQIKQKPDYPDDVPLNVCIAGSYVLRNERYVPREIDEYLTNDKRLIPISCRQGYAKCSVCPVGEESIITSDTGIAMAAERAGLEVLLISAGFFGLSGYPYGFIGGSCFKISEGEQVFTGTLAGHNDENKILSFLEKHGVRPVFLTERPAFDIGSVIPVIEK